MRNSSVAGSWTSSRPGVRRATSGYFLNSKPINTAGSPAHFGKRWNRKLRKVISLREGDHTKVLRPAYLYCTEPGAVVTQAQFAELFARVQTLEDGSFNPDDSIAEVDVAAIQVSEFGHTQRRRIEQLHGTRRNGYVLATNQEAGSSNLSVRTNFRSLDQSLAAPIGRDAR
jgi:hypothetical protein